MKYPIGIGSSADITPARSPGPPSPGHPVDTRWRRRAASAPIAAQGRTDQNRDLARAIQRRLDRRPNTPTYPPLLVASLKVAYRSIQDRQDLRRPIPLHPSITDRRRTFHMLPTKYVFGA